MQVEPEPTVAPVASGAPVPLVMAQAGDDTAAQPVVAKAQLTALDNPTIVYKLLIEEPSGLSKVKDPPSAVPLELERYGIGISDWEICRTHIIQHQQASGFYSRPVLEAGFFYTGCCCLVGCPVFEYVGQSYSRRQKMEKERCAEMTSRLAPYGVRVSLYFELQQLDQYLVFSRCRAETTA